MAEGKLDVTSGTRQRSVPYPRYTLQNVEKFASIVFSEGPRNCDQDIVAKKAGYSSSNNGSFFAMRSAASQFGMVIAKGDRISVTEEWIEAFHEDTVSSLRRARQQAIKQPSLYKQLFEVFLDNQLPPEDKLARTVYLDPKYGITKDAAVEAMKIFMESARYAGVLDERNYLRFTPLAPISQSEEDFDTQANNDFEQPKFRDSNSQIEGNRAASQGVAPKPVSPLPSISSSSDRGDITIPDGMEKQEITFRGGKKAYFILPVPLPGGEKARLKQWLDLIKMHIDITLEDDPKQTLPNTTNDDSAYEEL
ncbi:MAG TPA: hypothetical protein VGD58_11940 [Herpetosiphonaceae bacterium]